ncbi:MAG: hypothetical protein KKD29_04565 [Candidatus Omnitrophica bacterium]|nr:hypothetical protein [Candidatus Omnitrophota bacterium]MBU4488790.1 hypothetical protein [Candidatus Omnitrophota bacterium]MCG2705447.1 hypothetical protein [Candidatus Omnitrophota bacterium]
MNSELMISVLCLVSFFLLSWALLLRLYIKELEKKVDALEKYFSITKKLDNI